MPKYTGPEKEKILDPFRIALRIEIEGKRFLLSAAASAQHSVARRTFEYLASEEDTHAAKIQLMYQAIAETGDSIDAETDEREASHKIQRFNERLADLKDTVRATAGDIEAYKAALAMEQDTEDFYHEKIKETDDENIKRIYRYLIAEERAHSVMLESCLRFLEDPAAWFATHKSGA